MNKLYWRNKKVLITGYEGFLGSHLTKQLQGYGAKVSGLDILTYRKNTILSDSFDKINIIKGSVENYNLVLRVLREEKIEFIFHLAATSLVGEALKYPLKSFTTNIQGTWNILEASRQARTVSGIIIASSDKAYGIQKKLPYRESSPLCGSHPYDVSKSCADLLAYTYFHTYAVAACVTRCGNIFGPGDFNFSRIAPDAIRSIIKGKTLVIRSDGKFTRDYIYIDDIVCAYLVLAEKMEKLNLAGEAFNFSDESPVSVIELVKEIYRLAGRKPDFKITNQAKYEIRHQYLSSAKARRILGWKPKYSLIAGLKKTIQWYKDYFKVK